MASDRITVWDRAAKRAVPIISGIDPRYDSKGCPWLGIRMEHFQVQNLCMPEVSTTSFLAALCLTTDSRAALGPMGSRFAVEPAEMVVAGPGKIPALESVGQIEFLLLEIAPSYLMWTAEETVTDHFDLDQCRPFQDDQLRHIVLAMHQELMAGFPSGQIFGEYMGLSFATTFLRKRCAATPRTGSYRGGLSPTKLRLVKTFVNENLANSLSLTEIASLVQMGPCHFARAFKESTGVSPHQYVLRRRIDRAVEMLKNERSSLAGIAYDLGFSSQGHFTTVFRKFTGTQPSSYREQLFANKQITAWSNRHFAPGSSLQ
jgi:AraC family transcriptional regulator